VLAVAFKPTECAARVGVCAPDAVARTSVVILSQAAAKRACTCFYVYAVCLSVGGLPPFRGGGYPVFSVTDMSCVQRVYRQYRSEELESPPSPRHNVIGEIVSSNAAYSQLMTNNLYVDSRRCLNFPAAHNR
jgi:hypothetical protein